VKGRRTVRVGISALGRLAAHLGRFLDEILPALLIAFTIIMVSADIFLRNSFGRTVPHGIELSTYAFVWSVFLAAAGASREGSHFQVDLTSGLLKRWGKRGEKIQGSWLIFVQLLCVGVTLVMVHTSWDYTMRSWNRMSQGLGMPLGYFYMIFPLSFGLMAIAHSLHAWRQWKKNLGEKN